jgi:protein-S-isoprenylcysteine O-methyltransferase Ste14
VKLPLTILRHLVSIAALPFMVTIVVPIWIANRYEVPLVGPASFAGVASVVLGAALLALGLGLFSASLFHFATQGRGTLAPWDPPRRLVIRGPYRFVRNPMISGVVFVLIAEGLMLRSMPHLAWAFLFLLINVIYIPFAEEPPLENRFGEDYARYKRNVPRVIPRIRPWDGSGI